MVQAVYSTAAQAAPVASAQTDNTDNSQSCHQQPQGITGELLLGIYSIVTSGLNAVRDLLTSRCCAEVLSLRLAPRRKAKV